MSWRPREIKDRLMQGGGDRFIRSVKSASRRVGAGTTRGGKGRSGVDLHFKSLQEPAGELEAVLDDLEATSDPIFSGGAVGDGEPPLSSSGQREQRRRDRDRATSQHRTATSSNTTAYDGDPLLFPTASEGEGDGGRPTDYSEESEDIDLDEAEVMEPLQLAPGKTTQEELIDRVSPSSSLGEGEGETTGKKSGNNESANNNTHFQEQQHKRKDTTDRGLPLPPALVEPTLEDLLERGSAALLSHSSSSSPHTLPRSPLALEDSPLTSPNEADPLSHLSTHHSHTTATTNSGGKPAARHIGFDNKSPSSEEKKGVGIQDVDGQNDLFSDPQPSALSRSPDKGTHRGENVSSGHCSTPTAQEEVSKDPGESSHRSTVVNDEQDDLFPDDRNLSSGSEPAVAERMKAALEDDLFPDDSKHLQDSENALSRGKSDTLVIREDHFSPSPEQQRRDKSNQQYPHPPPPRPSPQIPSRGVARQNNLGRTPPPRPPRSPQLASRLRERQSSTHTATTAGTAVPVKPSSPHPPRKISGIATRVSTVRPLSTSPPTTRTLTDPTDDPSQPPPEKVSQTKSSSEPPDTLPQAPAELETASEEPETHTPHSASDGTTQEIDSVELPFLPLHVHLPLALLLYFYYTFNPFVYLAGLAAGFLLFYLCLGALFVAYVRREAEEMSHSGGPVARDLSPEFMKSMNIRLEDYETRFTAPSRKNRFEFTATLHYDFATHHRRDRLQCRLKLLDDFQLHIRIFNSEGDTVLKDSFHLHREKARITIVPEDVFENRKRRWSKKYPIRVEVRDSEFFLFSNVSRFKQEWFYRLREAAKGTTTERLVQRQRKFYQYMQRYFSTGESSQQNSAPTAPPPSKTSSPPPRGSIGSVGGGGGGGSRSARHHSHKRHKVEEGAVQYSSTAEREEDMAGGSISISSSTHTSEDQPQSSIASSVFSSDQPPPRPSSARSLSSTASVSSITAGNPRSLESYWINALTARIYWDVWHEERWKRWIVTRIERKLVRIKTPRFLDPLQLTDIAIGESMPVINRLYDGPFLRVDGVWVYLDVEYEGEFVMTIKTRLKLSRGKKKEKEEEGTEMKAVKHHSRLGHSHVQESSGVDPEDDSETGSEEEEEEEDMEDGYSLSNPLEEEEESEGEDTDEKPAVATGRSETHSTGTHRKKRGAKLKKVVSNITRRVANNRLVRRATERAVERARSVPLELRVEVRKLKGIVAVNIPPPPSDTIWYGFQSTPKLDLVARPKLGKRAVTFSQITHWIERKLCSLVDEKLTLPNMEDLVIPILNSGLPEDTPKQLP